MASYHHHMRGVLGVARKKVLKMQAQREQIQAEYDAEMERIALLPEPTREEIQSVMNRDFEKPQPPAPKGPRVYAERSQIAREKAIEKATDKLKKALE